MLLSNYFRAYILVYRWWREMLLFYTIIFISKENHIQISKFDSMLF